jgi:hypothetical protein
MQAGVKEWTGSAAGSGELTVTFPVAFSNAPIVIATGDDPSDPSGRSDIIVSVNDVTSSWVTIYWKSEAGKTTLTDVPINWLAIGPE